MKHQKAIRRLKKSQIMQELGFSGLKQMGGQIYADPDWRLTGVTGAEIYDLMSRSDPIIAGGLFIIESMVKQVPWFIKPGDRRRRDIEAAAHLESCIYDMSTSWNQCVMEILTILRFGWQWSEMIYKIRRGRHQKDRRFKSQYNDGSIGWRRWAPRAQTSLWRWVFDEEGDRSLIGMEQRDPMTGEIRFLPLSKSLLFRFRPVNDNPEGESPLRGAYEPWETKCTIEELLKLGLERDLAGYPVLYAPKEVVEGSTTDDDSSYSDAMDLVTGIKNDEDAGCLISSECDSKGNRKWDLKLLSSGGQRAFNLPQIINMYDQRIAASFLVDILLLGSGRQGSYALAETKGKILSYGISSILDTICEVINQHAVEQLAELNPDIYEECEKLPELWHGKVENPNLEQLSQALQRLGYRAEWKDQDGAVENYIRQLADLPVNKQITVEGDVIDDDEGMPAKESESDLLEKAYQRVAMNKAKARMIGGSVKGRAIA